MIAIQPIDKRLLIYLVIGSIIAYLVSTYIHELGHYSVARYLGYGARIGFNRTYLVPSDITVPPQENFYIYLGGPVLSVLLGTIGLSLLLTSAKSFRNSNQLNIRQWILIFFSLNWALETATFLASLCGYLLIGHLSESGDEIRIAVYLQMPKLIITVTTAIIGVGVLAIVLLKFIPKSIRTTFILSGLIAGIILKVIEVIIIHKLFVWQP